ncbi:hypothetical protein [Erythrobacter longus]|uniref:hypothetical protein n=1 Tax=Erythrobacter longus TaxID=1044 RepID=UPI0005594497|nr:hypothetical protein [Erythrobacter longus]
MFGKKNFSRTDLIASLENIDGVKIQEVVSEERTPVQVICTLNGLFQVRIDLKGMAGVSPDCDRAFFWTSFVNDGSCDLSLINGYNSREPRAYAYMTEQGIVVCCHADFFGMNKDVAEMTLSNAMTSQKKGLREFSILRNAYVKTGTIENVGIDPDALK